MLPIVKEFYSNMLRWDQHTILVRNVQVLLDLRVINAFHNLPSDIDFEYSKIVENMTAKKWSVVLKTLTVEGSSWLNKEGIVVNRIDLKLVAKIWAKFLNSQLIPTTHTTTVSHERLILLYAIIKGVPIDVGKIMEREISEFLVKNTKFPLYCFPHSSPTFVFVSRVKISAKDESIKNE